MKTLVLGKDQFKKDGCYNEYIGGVDLSDFEGHLEIEADLGWTRFKRIKVSGHIHVSAGSGISAGWGISAGEGISAGLTIICKKVLNFRFQIFAGVCRWKKTNDEDKKIQCLRLEGGEVAYGILEESKKENK